MIIIERFTHLMITSIYSSLAGVTMNNSQIDLDDITMTNVIKEPSSSILDESKSLAQSKGKDDRIIKLS